MKTIVTNLQGEREYLSLPIPEYEHLGKGCKDWESGVSLLAIWRGPRTGRTFIGTYSIWDNGRGAHVGYRVVEVDKQAYLRACDMAGIDPSIESETV